MEGILTVTGALRIIGILFLLVGCALAVILVLTGLELRAGVGQFLREAWLPLAALLACLVAGVYLIWSAGRPARPSRSRDE